MARYSSIAFRRSPSTSSACIAAFNSMSADPRLCGAADAPDIDKKTSRTATRPDFIGALLVNATIRVNDRSSRFDHDSAVEPIAEPAHAEHVTGRRCAGLDLLAEVRNLIVDHVRRDEGGHAPGLVDQLLPAQRPPPVANENRKNLELERCQLDDLSAPAQFAPHEIHFEVAEAIHVLDGRRAAAQRRLDPGAQFARAVRLGDVVVRAELEPQDLLSLERLGRQHDDRRADAGAPDLPTDLEAVLARQHHVEEDGIERLFDRMAAPALAVVHDEHVVALRPEVVFERHLNTLLVLDDENPF